MKSLYTVIGLFFALSASTFAAESESTMVDIRDNNISEAVQAQLASQPAEKVSVQRQLAGPFSVQGSVEQSAGRFPTPALNLQAKRASAMLQSTADLSSRAAITAGIGVAQHQVEGAINSARNEAIVSMRLNMKSSSGLPFSIEWQQTSQK